MTSSRRWGVSALVAIMLFAGTASAQSFDAEGIRDSLRRIVELQILNAQQLGDAARAASLYDELATLDLLTAEDLLAYEGASSQLAELELRLVELTEVFDELAENGVEFPSQLPEVQEGSGGSGESDGPQTPNTIGLTNANYDICTSTRSDGATAQGLLIAVHVAQNATAVGELVRDIADLGCGTVVVAIGAAGNPQNAACSISEGIFNGLKIAEVAANTAYEQLIFCDGIIDGAEIEGCYERASDNFDLTTHVHSDLELHDAEIKALLADMLMQILDALEAHDTKMSVQHASHEASMTSQYVSLATRMSTGFLHAENLVNWVNMIHGQKTNGKIDQVDSLVMDVKNQSAENQTLLQEIKQLIENNNP